MLTKIQLPTLVRQHKTIDFIQGNEINLNQQTCLDFASNDYLGLRKHPKVIAALIEASQRYGLGSGASAVVSGYSSAHKEVEQAFANWLGVDRCLLFSSGYSANIGLISALSKRHDNIFSDKLCHASLLDGIMLTRAKHIRYQHANITYLTDLAKQHQPNLMITDSVFSMEGDIAPIHDLVPMAQQYQANLIIDDAHGIGVLGPTGKGVQEYFSLTQNDYTCLVLPLGKAFNAMGAIVAGQDHVIESILQFARSYIYSTALPPAICLGIKASLEVLQTELWRQQKLQENITCFLKYAIYKDLALVSKEKTPIKSIIIGDNEKVIRLQQWLLDKGLHVAAIRPPTVPNNSARLRISLNSLHTQEQIINLLDHIKQGLTIC